MMRTFALLCGLLCLPGCGAPGRSETPHPALTPKDLYRQGQEHAVRGDLLRAEQYLALAVRAGYPARSALPALVRICLRASRLRAALTHAQPVLAAHPESRNLRYLVATLHLGLGQRRAARRQLETLTSGPDTHDGARALLVAMDDPGWIAVPRQQPPPPAEQENR